MVEQLKYSVVHTAENVQNHGLQTPDKDFFQYYSKLVLFQIFRRIVRYVFGVFLVVQGVS